jgi:polyhydroxyalkanoate synthesis regulator phasin
VSTPSKGEINQALNNDLRGLVQRGAVTKEEAKELRQQLTSDSAFSQRGAVNRIKNLLAKSPSHRNTKQGLRTLPTSDRSRSPW